MKERCCKFLDAGMKGCFCGRSPQGRLNKWGECHAKGVKECPKYEPDYDKDDKDLIKELFKFMQKEVIQIGKMTTTDSFGERPLLFFEAFGELKKRIEEKYGIEQ